MVNVAIYSSIHVGKYWEEVLRSKEEKQFWWNKNIKKIQNTNLQAYAIIDLLNLADTRLASF